MSDTQVFEGGLQFREKRLKSDNSFVGVTAIIEVDGKSYEGAECATRGEAVVSAMQVAFPDKEIKFTPQAAMSQALVGGNR